MSRTVTEIYDALIAEKEANSELIGLVPDPDTAQTLLSDLTTNSKVAIWRLMFWVLAVGIWVHEKIFDKHKEEMDEFADSLIGGTARWLRLKAFEWQNGDALEFDDDTKKFSYAVDDDSKKLVKWAAIREAGGYVFLKVAKDDGSGNPTFLAVGSEFDSFTNEYINKIKFAGTNVTVVSQDADLLRVELDLYYDPALLASDGSLISDPSVYPVEDAINYHIANLPFNGTLNLNELTDTIQAATGVKDPVITLAKYKIGTDPYADIVREHDTEAGYMRIDDLNYPLNTSITYIAESD